MGEIWVPTLSHPTSYEVSSYGRVRSLDRLNSYLVQGVVVTRLLKGKTLKPSIAKNGYLFVTLWDDHVARIERIHVLVLEGFSGARPSGFYGCHKNDDRTDNRAANLYWGTPRQNAHDKIRHGKQPRGTVIPWSKLSDDDVRSIRALAGSVSQRELSLRYGVGQTQISRIVNGQQWVHVA